MGTQLGVGLSTTFLNAITLTDPMSGQPYTANALDISGQGGLT